MMCCQCEGGEDVRIADFDVKLPPTESQKICRDSEEFGETMQGISFRVQGDIGAGSVMLKPQEANQSDGKAMLKVDVPATATFAHQ